MDSVPVEAMRAAMIDDPAAPRQGQALVIVGAGGHGAVCAELAQTQGYRILGFLDDSAEAGPGYPILRAIPAEAEAFFVAIGDNTTRARFFGVLRAQGLRAISLLHSSAVRASSATIAAGVFVGPLALVHTRARIHEGAIINSGALIEHDAAVGAFAHVSFGVIVEPGANVLPFAKLAASDRFRKVPAAFLTAKA